MAREILDLIGAVETRLRAQDHEMAREIADRLACALEGSAALSSGASWVPACAGLEALVGGRAARGDPLLDAISALGRDLPWRAAPRELCPGSFADGHAFVELFGPDGMVTADAVRMGLFLLRPGVFYPPHAHRAEEIYLVLAGAGAWQRSVPRFEAKGPDDLIHHAPLEPHAIKTAERGLLTLWAWRGEIGFESYRYL